MNHHIKQCIHNEDFLHKLISSFPGSFFDWKTTASFYCAVHLIRGLATHEGDHLSDDHGAVFEYIKVKTKSAESRESKAFRVMYRNCRCTRYDGLTSRDIMEKLWEGKLKENEQRLGILKSFVTKSGVSIGTVEAL